MLPQCVLILVQVFIFNHHFIACQVSGCRFAFALNLTGGTNQSETAGAEADKSTDSTNATLAKRLNVVTSVSPITNIVKNVGGDKIELTGLVPEWVNSHTFELVPSDVVKVNDADLVIIDGLGLETNRRRS